MPIRLTRPHCPRPTTSTGVSCSMASALGVAVCWPAAAAAMARPRRGSPAVPARSNGRSDRSRCPPLPGRVLALTDQAELDTLLAVGAAPVAVGVIRDQEDQESRSWTPPAAARVAALVGRQRAHLENRWPRRPPHLPPTSKPASRPRHRTQPCDRATDRRHRQWTMIQTPGRKTSDSAEAFELRRRDFVGFRVRPGRTASRATRTQVAPDVAAGRFARRRRQAETHDHDDELVVVRVRVGGWLRTRAPASKETV